jgi:hypothetical protein
MALALTPLLTLHADLAEPQAVGGGPFGNRQIFAVRSGWFKGERLHGRLLQGGGDWLLAGSDGYGRLDVRTTLETDDGALIFLSYPGILEMSEPALLALTGSGPPTEFGDLHYVIQPRFETGDEPYCWLNAVVALGEGRVLGGAVEYEINEARSAAD